MPFNRHFGPEEQDKTLKRRLLEELPGVFNWCLEGLWLMKETGFEPPRSVLAATAQYQHDSDKLSRFVEEKLVPDPEGEVPVTELYSEYKAWCRDNGHKVDSMPSFKQGIEQLGEVRRKRVRDGDGEGQRLRYLYGYSFISGPDGPDDIRGN